MLKLEICLSGIFCFSNHQLYSPAQFECDFAVRCFLGNACSQVFSFFPLCFPSFFACIRFNVPAVEHVTKLVYFQRMSTTNILALSACQFVRKNAL